MQPFLDSYASAYLDDVRIYSENYTDHVKHMRTVLTALQQNSLQLKPEKCEFHRPEVPYLGMIVGRDGNKMDQGKVEAI